MLRFVFTLVLLFTTPTLAAAQQDGSSPPPAGGSAEAPTTPAMPATPPTPEALPDPVIEPAPLPDVPPPAAAPVAPETPTPPTPPEVNNAEEAETQALNDLGVVEDDLETNMEVFRRGSFSLRIGGMLQVLAAPYVGDDADQDEDDPMDTEGFRVRRARIGFGGTIYRHWDFYLAVDLMDTVGAAMGWSGDHGAEVLDARITWTRFPFARISAGVDKVPFSAFALASSSRMELMERPLSVRKLGPDRRVGLTVAGDLWRISYAAGVFNGSAGVTTGNQLAGIAAAAHVQAHILGKPTSFVPDKLRISVGGSYMFDNAAAASMHKAAGNLCLRFFRVKLAGEILWEQTTVDQQPSGSAVDSGDSVRYGAVGELSVFIWQEYLQAALRYEYFDDNNELSTVGRQQLFYGGVNFYILRDKLKIMANYIRRYEMDGTAWDNDIFYAQIQAKF